MKNGEDKTDAGVAKPGQRRRTEAPVPQGFVGSNPTPRTKFYERGYRRENSRNAENLEKR